MKNLNIRILIGFIFFSITTILPAQTYEQYIKNSGANTLAMLAHPTSTYIGGNYQFVSDGVLITVNYTDGVQTKVKLFLRDGVVTDVRVIHDTDWFPPFFGTELIKNILLELIEENEENNNSSELRSYFERKLRKSMYDFSGIEMLMLIMTLEWYAY